MYLFKAPNYERIYKDPYSTQSLCSADREEVNLSVKGKGKQEMRETQALHCSLALFSTYYMLTDLLHSISEKCWVHLFYPPWISLQFTANHVKQRRRLQQSFIISQIHVAVLPEDILAISFTTVKINHIFGGTCINIYVCIQTYFGDQ